MIGDLAQAARATFDPGEWLDTYAAAGGWWVVTDERLWFGWPADPYEKAVALRLIYREVESHPERLAAIRRLIEQGRAWRE